MHSTAHARRFPQRLGRGWVRRARERDIPPSIQVGNGTWDGSGQFMGMKEGGGGVGVGIRRPDRRPRWPGRLSCSDSFAFAVGKKKELQLSVEIMATRAMKGVTTFKVPLHSQKIASFPSFLSALILGPLFLSKPGSERASTYP